MYLETTIPNYLFANDVPEEREITRKFFTFVKRGKYDIFVSEVVKGEIERTTDIVKRKKLLAAIQGIKKLPIVEKSRLLAEEYILAGIIPPRYRPDALHIAIATLNRMDVLVTWNMEHLANPVTRLRVTEINHNKGFKIIDIATPEEVIASGYKDIKKIKGIG